jgi:hypothetical protein
MTWRRGEIHALGIDLFLHQQGLDTTTPAGKAMFQMMDVFAEFERAMIRVVCCGRRRRIPGTSTDRSGVRAGALPRAALPPPQSPVERGGRGLSPMAMFSIAVVDRGFKRLPLCGATILPFLDFLAQPLDFGRGHRA